MTEKNCTLLFLRKDDQILLAMKKRGFGAGRFNGVGGKIEPNETLEQALVRECQEEINVTPVHYWKVAEHNFIQDSGSSPWHMHVHVYLCDQWEGTPIETEEMAPQWFPVTDVPYDAMWQDDKYWLPQVVSGASIMGKFTFDEADNMLTQDVRTVEVFTGEAGA
jgi:8-oxo-dGTP diphosphatase